MARASSLVSEPILMILPRPRGIMRLAASRPMTKALVRLASMTLRQSSVASSTIGLRSWMPALLTRMSISMPSRSNRSKAAMTAASSVTSKPRLVDPACRQPPWPRPPRRGAPRPTPLSTTAAPAAASPSAMARPRPREEPVTRAVRPSRRRAGLTWRAPQAAEWRTVRSGRSKTAGQQLDAEAGPFHRVRRARP